MARTLRQQLGDFGESLVVRRRDCPRCKRIKPLKRLPINFRCADVICDFCGYLAQVKAVTVRRVDVPPPRVLGAAWGPQEERMKAGIYFPMFLVLRRDREHSIWYLSADLQVEEMFEPRKPLSAAARRANWQGFIYRLDRLKGGGLVRLE
ncbi:DpnI domain-containing protein [Reyranella sp.]|uniref:DpnI domain-containing protein n=1 Tax=Reyranella sp. TaxID=1929291 RepID=UPI00403607B2